MTGLEHLREFIAERGARYCVTGTIRPGEYYYTYAFTGDEAEAELSKLEERRIYDTRIHSPINGMDLLEEMRQRGASRSYFLKRVSEQTALLRAVVIRAADQDMSESAMARQCGVDRATIRTWLGK